MREVRLGVARVARISADFALTGPILLSAADSVFPSGFGSPCIFRAPPAANFNNCLGGNGFERSRTR